MKKFSICAGILAISAVCFAADTWTNVERLQNRDAVVTGEVKSISKFAVLAGKEDIFVAEISVEKVIKNNDLITGNTLQVFYLESSAADDSYQGHVKLTQGQKADFYLDIRPFFQDKNVLFIDATSDVQKPNSSKS